MQEEILQNLINEIKELKTELVKLNKTLNDPKSNFNQKISDLDSTIDDCANQIFEVSTKM